MKNTDKKEISAILQISSTNTISTCLGCTNLDKKRKKIGKQNGLEGIRRRIDHKLVG